MTATRYEFASDVNAGATPEAMEALVRVNAGYGPSYGRDPVSARAADLIREFLDADAEVRFLTTGTAANAISLAALCRPFEGVLAHEHAHALAEETGAPVFFGHGLGMIPLSGASGRIEPQALEAQLALPDGAYRQSPAVLSLTNATEYGTVYKAEALQALIAPAKAAGCAIHLDGARLANASPLFDPKSVARLGVDILVLGGSKAGMTPAEAVVVFDRKLAVRLDARLKQAGQLPSKGRFCAAPFVGMLEDDAYLRHAGHANAMAKRLAALNPFPLRHPVETNALFVDMDEAQHARLREAGWAVEAMLDGSIRFVTSWATTEELVDEFGAALRVAV